MPGMKQKNKSKIKMDPSVRWDDGKKSHAPSASAAAGS
jgi:hypothetical protein